MGERRCGESGCAVHVEWTQTEQRAGQKSTTGGMFTMVNGTVVKHSSRTRATRARSSSMCRFHRCRSDRIVEEVATNLARGVEELVVAGSDRDGESEHEVSSGRDEPGRPFDEGQDVARNSRVSARRWRKKECDQE